MRNSPTRFLVASGLILILVWLVYATLFAGIPYQDPTAEMSASYAFHSRVSSTILVIGLGALLLGMLCRVLKILLKKLGKMQESTKR